MHSIGVTSTVASLIFKGNYPRTLWKSGFEFRVTQNKRLEAKADINCDNDRVTCPSSALMTSCHGLRGTYFVCSKFLLRSLIRACLQGRRVT